MLSMATNRPLDFIQYLGCHCFRGSIESCSLSLQVPPAFFAGICALSYLPLPRPSSVHTVLVSISAFGSLICRFSVSRFCDTPPFLLLRSPSRPSYIFILPHNSKMMIRPGDWVPYPSSYPRIGVHDRVIILSSRVWILIKAPQLFFSQQRELLDHHGPLSPLSCTIIIY